MSEVATRTVYPFSPDYAVAPGETLKETLEALGMSQVELAERTGLSTKHVNQVVKGVAAISPETALLLEKATGVPGRFWNRLEANFQDQKLRLKERSHLESELGWLQRLPGRELIKRGAVPDQADPISQLQALFGFFGVADGKAWERVWLQPQASFRISKAYDVDEAALAAWLRLGELEALDLACGQFDREALRLALSKIRELTAEAPEQFEPAMKDLCAQAGVAVVVVPEIKGARVSGAARWMTPTKALIQLSLRYKWEDHFWFSFFHEVGHILLHGKKETFVDEGQGSDQFEDEANSFAETTLIPRSHEPVLPSLKTQDQIRAFARELGISPGIVVGRLQKEGLLKYSEHNNLRRRFEFVPA